nr:hypothetical protein [Tannerella forsythia]
MGMAVVAGVDGEAVAQAVGHLLEEEFYGVAHGCLGDVCAAARGGRVTDVGHGKTAFGADACREIVRVGRQQVVVEIRFDGVPCFTLRARLQACGRSPSAAKEMFFFIRLMCLYFCRHADRGMTGSVVFI